MWSRLINKIRLSLERFLLLGTGAQLFSIIILILGVSILGGLCVFIGSDQFPSLPGAIWWAFLRLSDPGYLGDDHGLFIRAVSTVLTVLGYVLFLGTLIAFITKVIYEQLRLLESGLTPIKAKNHIIFFGYNNYVLLTLRELLRSELNLKMGDEIQDIRKTKIIILAEDYDHEMVVETKETLGPYYNRDFILFRTGDPLRIEDLRRVDFLNAAAIIMPGSGAPESRHLSFDARNLKILLTIKNEAQKEGLTKYPPAVVEILSKRKVPLAKHVYDFQASIIASDLYISRAITQNIRYTGLAGFYKELLTEDHGNEVFVNEYDLEAPTDVATLKYASKRAVLIGVLKKTEQTFAPHINPPHDLEIEEGDQLIYIAEKYEDSLFDEDEPLPQSDLDFTNHINFEKRDEIKRILILGWNQHAPTIYQELSSFKNEKYKIVNLSQASIAEKELTLSHFQINKENVAIEFLQGDYTDQYQLEMLDLESFDNIILLSSDWTQSEEESDARSIMSYLVLNDMIRRFEKKPDILVELMDHDNEKLFPGQDHEMIIPPLMMGHIMGRVALKPLARAAYSSLLNSKRCEILLASYSDIGFEGDTIRIYQLWEYLFERGLTFLGFVGYKDEHRQKRVWINPDPNIEVEIRDDYKLIILTDQSFKQ
jgi:hypothetical protein